MATVRQTNGFYEKNYIYGSAVRQEEVAPERIRRERSRVSERTLENRRRAEKMNLRYVFFLTLATVATLAICIGYLQLRSEVDARSTRITRMETELKDAKAENIATYNRIMKNVNLEEIRRIAIEDLHMVYANKDQVVFYETEESDYVRQYEDIPDTEGSSFGLH